MRREGHAAIRFVAIAPSPISTEQRTFGQNFLGITYIAPDAFEAITPEELADWGIDREGSTTVQLAANPVAPQLTEDRKFGDNFLGITYIAPAFYEDIPLSTFDALRKNQGTAC